METEASKLRSELKEALQREARNRQTSVEEFLDLQVRLAALGTTIGERGASILELHAKVGERDTCIHELNVKARERDACIHQLQLEQLAKQAELQSAYSDLEAFAWLLQETEINLEKTRRRTFGGVLCSLFQVRSPAMSREVKVPPGDFSYHLLPSPFRLYRGEKFTLTGWVFSRDGRPVTALRARIAGVKYEGKTGFPAPEAAIQAGFQSKNLPPGFEVTFDTPPGRHHLALEARLDDGAWRSFLNIPVWCRK